MKTYVRWRKVTSFSSEIVCNFCFFFRKYCDVVDRIYLFDDLFYCSNSHLVGVSELVYY